MEKKNTHDKMREKKEEENESGVERIVRGQPNPDPSIPRFFPFLQVYINAVPFFSSKYKRQYVGR